MSTHTSRLDGKKTIVTAAASGMGKAGRELFARLGARIASIDRDEAALAQDVDGIRAARV